MSSLGLDLHLVLRRLLRHPDLTLCALVPLTLAIGANVTLFGVIQEVLLVPRSLLGSDDVYVLWETSAQRDELMSEVSYPDFLDWRSHSEAFEDMAAMGSINWAHQWHDGEAPRNVVYRSVSWSFFDVLGAPPRLGRTFVPDDDAPGADRVVVLSHGFWQGRLGGAQDVVGEALLLGPEGTEPYRVVGVMPPEFRVPYGAELWAPLGRDMAGFGAREARGLGVLFVVARLEEGVTPALAEADVTRIVRGLSREVHQRRHWDQWGVALTRLDAFELGRTRVGLWTIGGAAMALLWLTCLNVGGLFLARSLSRRREVSIRCALGGGSRLVMREAFLESGLLVILAAAGGLQLARVATPLLLSRLPQPFPDASGMTLDLATGFFVVTVCALTAVLVTLPTVVSARGPAHLLDLASGRGATAPLGDGKSVSSWPRPRSRWCS